LLHDGDFNYLQSLVSTGAGKFYQGAALNQITNAIEQFQSIRIAKWRIAL